MRVKLSRALAFDLRSPRALSDGFRGFLFGESGAGKSSCATLIIEQVLAAGGQIIVLDPHREYKNLWSVAPREVVTVGYNAPIDVDSAADCISLIKDGASLLIDLSHWALMPKQRDAFVLDFARQLYQLRTKEPKFTLLVLEEGANYAPQAQLAGQNELVAVFVTIIVEGRKFGIQTLITTQIASLVDYRVLKGSNVKIFMRVSDFQEWKYIRPYVPPDLGVNFKGENGLRGIKHFESGEALVISRWVPEARVQLLRPKTELRKAEL